MKRQKHTAQRLLTFLFVIALILTLSSCERFREKKQYPDPVEVLQDQVETERGLRSKAETTASKEAVLRRKCELTIVVISILAAGGFIIGTMIGSRGRRHADER